MAAPCRSAVMIGRRSICTRTNPIVQTVFPNHKSPTTFSSSNRQFSLAASRLASVLGSVETMLPLHSTIAAARLKSNIAVDTTCWSLFSLVCNTSVSNDLDNITSSMALIKRRSSPSSVMLIVLTFLISWYESFRTS